MPAVSDGTARGSADPPVPDTGASSDALAATCGEDVDKDRDTLQGLLVAQVLVAIVGVGYGVVTGDWSETWEIVGGCLIFAVALCVFFWARKAVRRHRADRARGAPGNSEAGPSRPLPHV